MGRDLEDRRFYQRKVQEQDYRAYLQLRRLMDGAAGRLRQVKVEPTLGGPCGLALEVRKVKGETTFMNLTHVPGLDYGLHSYIFLPGDD